MDIWKALTATQQSTWSFEKCPQGERNLVRKLITDAMTFDQDPQRKKWKLSNGSLGYRQEGGSVKPLFSSSHRKGTTKVPCNQADSSTWIGDIRQLPRYATPGADDH